jgi:hypothetical protein
MKSGVIVPSGIISFGKLVRKAGFQEKKGSLKRLAMISKSRSVTKAQVRGIYSLIAKKHDGFCLRRLEL